MAWYTAVFLGLVQGLAEFLPISSSGHLLLFQHLFGINDGGRLFTIVLHLATLLAVVIVYRRELWQLIRHPWCRTNWYLLTATAISCVLVLLFKPLVDQLNGVAVLPYAFIISGLFLLLPTMLHIKTTSRPWVSCLAMGVAQGIAVVPGLTRSGLTITTGQLSGMPATEATNFSFLMSLPIVIASLVYEIFAGGSMAPVGIFNIMLAFLSALVAGIVAIKIMLKLMRKIECRWFAGYLLFLGLFLFCVGL